MFGYMLPHLKSFYEGVLEDGGSEGGVIDDVRKLGEHILTKGWQTFSDREITQAVKRWRHRSIRDKAERYAALEALGWIAPAEKPTSSPSGKEVGPRKKPYGRSDP